MQTDRHKATAHLFKFRNYSAYSSSWPWFFCYRNMLTYLHTYLLECRHTFLLVKMIIKPIILICYVEH